VLLNFWATWCAACRVETPWLVDLQRRHARDLRVVGVLMDDPGARGIAEFLRANRVTYPILLGGKSIAPDYRGARLLPQTFLIDRSGRVIETLTGIESASALEDRVEQLLRMGPRQIR
jgi:thiol-disulfide isomerase/thioredoxin